MEYHTHRKGNQHLITINTTEEDEVAGEEARKYRVQMKMSQIYLQDGTTLLSENRLAGVKRKESDSSFTQTTAMREFLSLIIKCSRTFCLALTVYIYNILNGMYSKNYT